MRIVYDREHDVMMIRLREAPIAESDEQGDGIILDRDEHGGLLGLELLDASERFADPEDIQFIVVGPRR